MRHLRRYVYYNNQGALCIRRGLPANAIGQTFLSFNRRKYKISCMVMLLSTCIDINYVVGKANIRFQITQDEPYSIVVDAYTREQVPPGIEYLPCKKTYKILQDMRRKQMFEVMYRAHAAHERESSQMLLGIVKMRANKF